MNTSPATHKTDPSINQEFRKPVQLQNVSTTGERKSGPTQIWYDIEKIENADTIAVTLQRLPNFQYTGVVLKSKHIKYLPLVPPTLKIIFSVSEITELEGLKLNSGILMSDNEEILKHAPALGLLGCLHQYVDDEESLHRAIYLGKNYSHLMIHFRDPTNIPLELVIASLQATGTTLLKEITNANDVDDAVVSLGVMEVGADGVVYSPTALEDLDTFARKRLLSKQQKLLLETATIVESTPIGMGFRACLDLATLFEATEGMIVGSTSQGGILCCPEVFYLPYMETRPFRVNAGGVHSYVYNANNRTDYMSELKAGSPVLVVGLDGKSRLAPIGRVKTEMRPLRLIVAQFETGEKINVILQDDWHVRVFSPEGKPLNVTELKNGHTVLAYKANPGRHVGIKVEEKILET